LRPSVSSWKGADFQRNVEEVIDVGAVTAVGELRRLQLRVDDRETRRQVALRRQALGTVLAVV
jgi:hypothetical protein